MCAGRGRDRVAIVARVAPGARRRADRAGGIRPVRVHRGGDNMGGMRRKLNAEEKRARLAGDVRVFVKTYGRKSQKGIEPNDRRYDRDAEKKVKQMKPEDLDRLLREDADE